MKYSPHAAAVERAKKLIAKGAVNLTDPWFFDDGDEKSLLGDPINWPEYAAWHLGAGDDTASKNSQFAWNYPLGKHDKIYRSALRATQLQALKNGDADVAHTARDLLAKLSTVEKRPWYEMKQDDDESAEIFIFDEIGFWGITAKDFINDFKALKASKKLTLHINSPGGAVFDGLAIFNLLNRSDAHITTVVDGVAASIASVIAMVGDEIVMPENAFMFIHNPMGGAWGYSGDLRSVADTLDKMAMSIKSAYRRSKLDDAAITDLMDEETWLTAQEAVDLGLADRLEKPVKLAANFSLSRFRGVPATLLARRAESVGAEPDETKDPASGSAPSAESVPPSNEQAEIAALCTEAGLPALIAPALANATPLAEVKTRIEEAAAIRGLCKIAKHPEQADAYIAAGLTPAQARERLFDLLVAQDLAAPIDTSLPIDTTHVSVPAPRKHAASWDRAFQSIKGGR